MEHQFRLISGFFLPLVSDHTVDNTKQEGFALQGKQRISQQIIDAHLDQGPLC